MLEAVQSVLLFGALVYLSLLAGFCILLITAAALDDEIARRMKRRRARKR